MPPSIDVFTSSSASVWPTELMPLKRPLPSPNVMVPKQSFETRRPVLPSVAYSMAFSFSTITLICKLFRSLLNRTQCNLIRYYTQCEMLQESTACLFQGGRSATLNPVFTCLIPDVRSEDLHRTECKFTISG